jgi:hypothetical protein
VFRHQTYNAGFSQTYEAVSSQLQLPDDGFARSSSQLASPLLDLMVVGRSIQTPMHL